jgi:hypothetical protein
LLLKKTAMHCKPNRMPLSSVVLGLFHSLAPDFVEQLDAGQPGFGTAQKPVIETPLGFATCLRIARESRCARGHQALLC